MKIKRIVSLLLVLCLISGLAACSGKEENVTAEEEETVLEQVPQQVYDTPASSVKKNETVYVNIAPDGQVESLSVTDWLHTPQGRVYADDVTDLENVENLKTDSEPVRTEDGLRWYMDTTDLYYSGTSNKELPVSFDIAYYLNGKKTSAKKIAGKSGKIKVETTVTNNCKTADGMFLPVAVAGVAILDESDFSGVSVENGIAIGDASKEIAVTVCFPGMKESLNLEELGLDTFAGYSVSNVCSFEADAENFEIGNMYYVVIPLCAVSSGLIMPDSLEDLDKDVALLSKVIDAIGTVDFSSVVKAFSDNPGSVQSMVDMVRTAAELYNSNRELIRVLAKYLTEENVDAIVRLLEDVDAAQVTEALRIMRDPVIQAFIKGLPDLMKDLDTILPVIEEMSAEMQTPEIQKSIDNLPESMDALAGLLRGLEDNKELIGSVSAIINSGRQDAIDEIINSLTEVDFESSIEKYDNVIDHSDELLESVRSWISAGMDYKVFSKCTSSQSTSLMFIFRTNSVKRPAPAADSSAVQQLPWYKRVLSVFK